MELETRSSLKPTEIEIGSFVRVGRLRGRCNIGGVPMHAREPDD